MRRLGILLLGFALAGCTPAILVVDPDGVPIEGARIDGVSLSMSGQWTTTNWRGRAEIPRAFQKTKWVSVSKPGYVPVSGVDVDQPRPIKVTLVPEAATAPGPGR